MAFMSFWWFLFFFWARRKYQRALVELIYLGLHSWTTFPMWLYASHGCYWFHLLLVVFPDWLGIWVRVDCLSVCCGNSCLACLAHGFAFTINFKLLWGSCLVFCLFFCQVFWCEFLNIASFSLHASWVRHCDSEEMWLYNTHL